MLEAAQIMVNQNSNPSSDLYQRLDIDNIAMAGHSQGAHGAINATLASGGLSDGQVTSVLAVSIGDRGWMQTYNTAICPTERTNDPNDVFRMLRFGSDCDPVTLPAKAQMNNLGAPLFFARAEGDWLSAAVSIDWYPDASVPWATGSLLGYPVDFFTPHLRLVHPCDDPFVQEDTCLDDTLDDPPGAYGYMNAWLVYTLFDNPLARAAFVGPGEIDGNARWAFVDGCCLP